MGGICLRLLSASGARVVAETSSDSNGYYGFDVAPGNEYAIEVDAAGYAFTLPNIGDEDHDSDLDPASGRTATLLIVDSNLHVDTGLVTTAGTSASEQPPSGEVGPVRSARLINIHIHDFLQDSCLIYAGSTREIRDQIPGCAEVFEEGDGGVGAMLDVDRMVLLAEKNGANQGAVFDYSGNVFSEVNPSGGYPVARLDVYAAELNQSAWVYDPALQGWHRYVDTVDELHPGLLRHDVDRMTGRQLYVENVVVLYVEHEVLAPAIIDMHIEQGETGRALLFRDGMMHRLEWSTRAGEYEQQTGLRRPLKLLDGNGDPVPLRPGRTWFIVATPFSLLQMAPGQLRLRIMRPPGDLLTVGCRCFAGSSL
jgi:hypothetical protein